MARKKNRSQVSDEWLSEEILEAPKLSSRDTKKLERRKRFYRIWVWGSLFLVPVIALSNFVLIGNILSQEEEVQSAVESPQKARAITEVQAWLDGKPSPIPNGRILSWDYVERMVVPEPEQKDPNVEPDIPLMEIHHLSVGTDTGVTFDVAVQLSTTRVSGTVLVGGPSMILAAPGGGDAGNNVQPWPTLEEWNPTEATTVAVETWLRAYTGSSPDELRVVVGDERENVSYLTLPGGEFSDLTVSRAAIREMGDDGESARVVVVRVSFALSWTGYGLEDGETATSHVSYDVLITGASTASPRVVAWGAPGSGAVIEPYANAIVDRSFTEEDGEPLGDPTDTPSPEAGDTAATDG